MKIAAKLLLCLISFAPAVYSQGKIEILTELKTEYVKNREVRVWTPEQYNTNNQEKFPVLYMQDGQNIFNDDESVSGMSWHAAETAQRLIDEGTIEPFIIVAISSSQNRFYEYFPQKSAEYLDDNDLEQIEKITGTKQHDFISEAYLKFITEELKPYVDNNYRTASEASDTTIAGASMGGLIALYAICEYPDIFGQAACVSTHWPVTSDYDRTNAAEAVRKYLDGNLPSPENHRIYFDYGSQGVDQYYGDHQKQVDNLMSQKGYTMGENWTTKRYQDADHNEKAYAARFDEILMFLYKK